MVTGSALIVANAGDARIVGITNEGASLRLSKDHKPNDASERQRIKVIEFAWVAGTLWWEGGSPRADSCVWGGGKLTGSRREWSDIFVCACGVPRVAAFNGVCICRGYFCFGGSVDCLFFWAQSLPPPFRPFCLACCRLWMEGTS